MGSQDSDTKLVCLKYEPILEALCELRFVTSTPGASALLPGLLQAELKEEYPKVEVLPSMNLPPAMRQAEPNLKYIHLYRLTGDRGAVSIGDHSISVSVQGSANPRADGYPGWASFRERIARVFSAVLATDTVKQVERISLKYINLLGAGELRSLSELTTVSLNLGERKIGIQPLQLRTEFASSDHAAVIQISNPAAVNLVDGGVLKGLVLEVDIVRVSAMDDCGSKMYEYLDAAHDEARSIFFELLSPASLVNHGPEYADISNDTV